MIRKSLVPPLALIGTVLVLWFAQTKGLLPATDLLLSTISKNIAAAGFLAVVVVAALENIVGVNTYFPGSVVILGVMAATYGDPSAALKTFFSIFTGQLAGLLISRAIGLRFGGSRKATSGNRKSLAVYTLLLAFSHPHSAAATSFALGASHHSRGFFIVCVGCLIWSIFWANVMYFGLGSVVQEVGWDYVTIAVALLWLTYELVLAWKSRKPID